MPRPEVARSSVKRPMASGPTTPSVNSAKITLGPRYTKSTAARRRTLITVSNLRGQVKAHPQIDIVIANRTAGTRNALPRSLAFSEGGTMVRPYSVLFVSTGNCVRSILAEASLNHWSHDRFRAFSAGTHPAGAVHPLALEVLRTNGLPTDG